MGEPTKIYGSGLVHGCDITVANMPGLDRTSVRARLIVYGVRVPEQADAEELAVSAEQAAKAALRHAKLLSLAAVDVDEWFALGDRIMQPASGLRPAVAGTICGYRKSDDARGIRPTLMVEWDDGERMQIDEDDLLFGLRGGAYVLA